VSGYDLDRPDDLQRPQGAHGRGHGASRLAQKRAGRRRPPLHPLQVFEADQYRVPLFCGKSTAPWPTAVCPCDAANRRAIEVVSAHKRNRGRRVPVADRRRNPRGGRADVESRRKRSSDRARHGGAFCADSASGASFLGVGNGGRTRRIRQHPRRQSDGAICAARPALSPVASATRTAAPRDGLRPRRGRRHKATAEKMRPRFGFTVMVDRPRPSCAAAEASARRVSVVPMSVDDPGARSGAV